MQCQPSPWQGDQIFSFLKAPTVVHAGNCLLRTAVYPHAGRDADPSFRQDRHHEDREPVRRSECDSRCRRLDEQRSLVAGTVGGLPRQGIWRAEGARPFPAIAAGRHSVFWGLDERKRSRRQGHANPDARYSWRLGGSDGCAGLPRGEIDDILYEELVATKMARPTFSFTASASALDDWISKGEWLCRLTKHSPRPKWAEAYKPIEKLWRLTIAREERCPVAARWSEVGSG